MSEEQYHESPPRGVYIQTFGCQMNEYDSAKIIEQLRGQNYVPVDSPDNADLILVNTCSVREKAEHKVYSLLGSLSGLKNSRPGTIIGVGGCVAQQRGEEILQRAPVVDLVFGTDSIFQLPDLLGKVRGGQRVSSTEQPKNPPRVENFIPDFGALAGAAAPGAGPQVPVKAHLAITKGCNNFCTFCVVPYTRGREVSREPENIIQEARQMARAGTREITLLGQNVNSYRAGGMDFVGLLERLNELDGLHRIRYTSPHPKDFTDELARAHQRLSRLCEHVHLPFQAGSDRILKAMKRRHTRGEYLDKVDRMRALVPEMSFSTDIIVGFPGETEEDFQATLEVMRAVRFDQVYAFKYSPRTNTPAAEYPGQVPEQERAERLARLFELYEQIALERNTEQIGRQVEVLVEGPHPRGGGALSGRTRGNRTVKVQMDRGRLGTASGPEKESGREDYPRPGDLLPTIITGARKFSLVGDGVMT